MHITLSKRLIERGVIKAGTEVEAVYRAVGLSGQADVPRLGTFVVTATTIGADEVLIEAASTVNGAPVKLSARAVQRLDGMEPARIASIYGLSDEGDPLKQGKRRGRKPKAQRQTLAG